MINKIESSLLTLSAVLYFEAKPPKLEQLITGISQIFFGTALLLRGNRSLKQGTKITLIGLGLGAISLGIVNTYLSLNSVQTPPLSNSWNITVSKALQTVDPSFKQYPIAKLADLPESDYEAVGWDYFKVHSIAEKKLYTTELGPCLGLSARGFDESGKLTHIGMAHKFMNDRLPEQFFDAMRQKVKGRIELFISGGDEESNSLLHKMRKLAKIGNIAILNDVSKRFFKEFYFPFQGMMHSASRGIHQIYFDQAFNPMLQAGVSVIGLPNFDELI